MKPLTPEEILSREQYEGARGDIRRRMIVEKTKRRVQLGPHCTVHFESRDTLSYQVHEMLRVEGSWQRPGALDEELASYNPLVPQPGELSATLMLEYERADERATELPKFVGLDRHVSLQIGDTDPARPTFDRGQIDEQGVSAVQYLKWRLSADQVARLQKSGTVVRLAIDHPAYHAQAVLGEETRLAIMHDPM
jgi:hypothetical protein